MSIKVICHDPQGLVDAFYAAIKSGDIATWAPDKDRDLGHTSEQWKGHGWWEPKACDGYVRFKFIPRKEVAKPTAEAEYNGFLVTTLLVHFSERFTRIKIDPVQKVVE